MKTVLLIAALLLAAPALAQENGSDYPELSGSHSLITPSIVCDSLEQVHTIIEALRHGGQYSSNAAYNRINNANPLRPACAPKTLKPEMLEHIVESYGPLETIYKNLRNVDVVELNDDGTTRYAIIEHDIGPGLDL